MRHLILQYKHTALRSLTLHKPVSDWLETLPHRISGLNISVKFLLDIKEMKRIDLWLNVKDNYTFFTVFNASQTWAIPE